MLAKPTAGSRKKQQRRDHHAHRLGRGRHRIGVACELVESVAPSVNHARVVNAHRERHQRHQHEPAAPAMPECACPRHPAPEHDSENLPSVALDLRRCQNPEQHKQHDVGADEQYCKRYGLWTVGGGEERHDARAERLRDLGDSMNPPLPWVSPCSDGRGVRARRRTRAPGSATARVQAGNRGGHGIKCRLGAKHPIHRVKSRSRPFSTHLTAQQIRTGDD